MHLAGSNSVSYSKPDGAAAGLKKSPLPSSRTDKKERLSAQRRESLFLLLSTTVRKNERVDLADAASIFFLIPFLCQNKKGIRGGKPQKRNRTAVIPLLCFSFQPLRGSTSQPASPDNKKIRQGFNVWQYTENIFKKNYRTTPIFIPFLPLKLHTRS